MLQQAYRDSFMSMTMFYCWYDAFQSGPESLVDEPQKWWPSAARNKFLQNTVAVIVGED